MAADGLLFDHDKRLDRVEKEIARIGEQQANHERRLGEIEGDLFANSKRGTNSLATRQQAVETALSILSAQQEQLKTSQDQTKMAVEEMTLAVQALVTRKETVIPVTPIASPDTGFYRTALTWGALLILFLLMVVAGLAYGVIRVVGGV